jgi:hypothetical protein
MRRARLSVALLVLVCCGPVVLAAPRQNTTKAPAETTETPTQFYLRYCKAVSDARSMEEVMAFWQKDMAADFLRYPPDQRVDINGIKHMYARFKDVKVTAETRGATGATLSLEPVGPEQKPMTGTVYLVKENGEWKLFGQEAWQ